MRILIDADACPVVALAEKAAACYGVPTELFCDTNHELHSSYSTVHTISAGQDAVDFALINACCRGDVVITQDYGVAALALGKGAVALHQDGVWYTQATIEIKLMERHLNARERRSKGKHHLKGPKRRTEQDDRRFYDALCAFLSGS